MLVFVAVMFFIFWTPHMLFIVVTGLWLDSIPSSIHRNIDNWLQSWAFINSCVNFFIYLVTSKYVHPYFYIYEFLNMNAL